MKIMLDCGAFSAWGRQRLPVGPYIEFIKANRHLLHAYVALDVIAGSPSEPATSPKVIERAAAESYDNWLMLGSIRCRFSTNAKTDDGWNATWPRARPALRLVASCPEPTSSIGWTVASS
jgi:hypothetical protein